MVKSNFSRVNIEHFIIFPFRYELRSKSEIYTFAQRAEAKETGINQQNYATGLQRWTKLPHHYY